MSEYLTSQQNKIAVIELKGEPYCQVKNGREVNCSKTLEILAINAGYEGTLSRNIERNRDNLIPLFEGGFYGVDAKIKKGQSLTYPEAFSLMTFVSMGVNKLVHAKLSPYVRTGAMDPETVFYQSISLLSSMSAKEGFVGLTPEEIAGMTAATLEIDTVIRVPATGNVLGIGGMGGDRGYKKNGDNSKLFSLSTMGAIVAANFGYVHKHHSYPNTSKVAGQSAIEAFGARSDQSNPQAFKLLQENVGLLMSSCHTTRLIHTLSHRLKGETINHVVGPLSIPVDRDTTVNAFIGVNDNVHPETIIQSLAILQLKKVQKYSNCVAFCGLNEKGVMPEHFNPNLYYTNQRAKEAIAIDEVAPPPFNTLASFLIAGKNYGTFVIEPGDFMDNKTLKQIDYQKLLVPNTEEDIILANRLALTGQNVSKTLYLAMTGALALFTKEYAHKPNALDQKAKRINRSYLRGAHQRVLEAIINGKSFSKLQEYVFATNNTT